MLHKFSNHKFDETAAAAKKIQVSVLYLLTVSIYDKHAGSKLT